MPKKTIAIGAMSLGALAIAASPASAVASVVAVDINGAVGGYNVLSTCKPVAIASTDPRFLTFVLEASADATGPSVGLSTTVICTMKDSKTHAAVGGASGALLGPHAEAVGTATLPFGHLYTLCTSGGATFLNGYAIGAKPC